MNQENDEMLIEYDFSGGVRGKYYEAYTKSSNVVILDPDVAEVFHDSASVNEALRLLAKIAKSMPASEHCVVLNWLATKALDF